MDFVKASDLAPLIPLEENQVSFQYQFYLDGAFEDPGQHVGAVKLDLTQLPFQFYKLMYKTKGTKWYIGFNVFQEGHDTRYQSFFWRETKPGKERLTSSGDWKKASKVFDLNLDAREEAYVNIPKYDHLYMIAKPMKVHFSLNASDQDITFDPIEYKVEIADTQIFRNQSNIEQTAHPLVSYEQEQEMGTSVTDTTTYEVGLSVSIEFKASIPFVNTSWKIKLDFKYTTSRATTASYSEKQTYKIEQVLDLLLPPQSVTYVSTIIYSANDVLGNLLVYMQMDGKVDDQILSGAFLKDMVEAMAGSQIVAVDDYSITYSLEGPVEASVVSKSEIVIDDEPPTISGGQLVHRGRVLEVLPTEAQITTA